MPPYPGRGKRQRAGTVPRSKRFRSSPHDCDVMTELTDSLPDRPLSTSEVSALEAQYDDYGFAPVGFFPDLDVVAAFVVIIDGERGYSLGYDRDGEGWVVVESFADGQDFAGVTERLQEWMGDDWAEFEDPAVEPE